MTEQLRFVPSSAVSPDSLSADFPSRPSPMEIHGACGVDAAMSQRLALAVRLARRDLQRSLAHRTVLGVQQVASCPVPPCQPEEMSCQPSPAMSEPAPIPEHSVSPPGGQQSQCQPAEEERDLAVLERALGLQVQRLRELCAREEKREQEGEGEEEEERATEQVSAMTRKLYDLEQKVRNRDEEAITGLAAARRAASRTLSSFSSKHPLPNQLLKLLGVLCEEGRSSQLLAQAQKYSDDLRELASLRPNPRSKREHRSGQRKPDHTGCGARRLLSRTSYGQQKMNSGKRRKSKQKGSRLRHTPHSVTSPPVHSHPQAPPSPAPNPPQPPFPHPPPSPASHPPPPSDPHPPPSPDPHPPPSPAPNTPQPPCPHHPQPDPPLTQPFEGVWPHLVTMTTTLKRIEEEQLMMCSRWNHPPTPTPQLGRAARAQFRGDSSQERLCAHLQPHPVLESLADQLLSETVTEVCSEMRYMCDHLATQLFSTEFHATPHKLQTVTHVT